MPKPEKQSGFTAVEALLIVLVIVVLGGAGWYVWKAKNTNKTSNTANNTSTTTPTVAANKWTGAGGNNNWSVAKNWSMGTPKDGQQLEINFTKINPNADGTIAKMNDDIPKLSIAKITFTGSSSNDSTFSIKGDTLTITGGILSTMSGKDKAVAPPSVTFENNLNLDGDQSVTASSVSAITLGSGADSSSLNIGMSKIRFVSQVNNAGELIAHVVGSGTLDFTSGTTYVGNGFFGTLGSNGVASGIYANPKFNGKVHVGKGVHVGLTGETGFGTSAVTIDNGGTLEFDGTGTNKFSFANVISMAGAGVTSSGTAAGIPKTLGAISACLTRAQEGCEAGTNVTLTGQVTLSGDTQLGMDPGCGAYMCEAPKSTTNTFTFTKPIKGSYTLTAVPNSMVKIVKP